MSIGSIHINKGADVSVSIHRDPQPRGHRPFVSVRFREGDGSIPIICGLGLLHRLYAAIGEAIHADQAKHPQQKEETDG